MVVEARPCIRRVAVPTELHIIVLHLLEFSMVVEAKIAADLKQLNLKASGDNPMSDDDYADALAKIIADAVKSASIPAGQVVIAVIGNASGVPNPAPLAVV